MYGAFFLVHFSLFVKLLYMRFLRKARAIGFVFHLIRIIGILILNMFQTIYR